ncbi:hypothetical protein SASPL_135357 [Salvia splendens]|uniref:Uncharacterized protein n=1 Tax=Salvia splendens TaxID=180675 RepID=A0A8X8WWD5_SALSN|nr:hypothetical protein SASPL_135357 [Salvia splendens]
MATPDATLPSLTPVSISVTELVEESAARFVRVSGCRACIRAVAAPEEAAAASFGATTPTPRGKTHKARSSFCLLLAMVIATK